jgi:hypothetical protein
MSFIAEIDLTSTPTVPPGASVRLAEAAPALWRVIDASGRVIGHIQALAEDAGIRYRARRFHVGSRAFRDLGEFWSAGDAIDCLRFAR